MMHLRPARERGHVDFGWLDSRHSFSFGQYYDARHMGFRALRVINDDRVAGGGGFPTHPHRDMEIVTYVLEGELAHRDSLGNGSVIGPGDVQRMSAGTGIQHSEFNASPDNPVRLLQIWMLPERTGLTPGYEQRHFDTQSRQGRWTLLGSRDGREGSVTIHQDLALFGTLLEAGQSVDFPLSEGRHLWLQVARGTVQIGDLNLIEGDGLAVSDESQLSLTAQTESELLLFELA